MTESKAPAKTSRTTASAKPDPLKDGSPGALPVTTDPAGITDQERKQPKADAAKPESARDDDPGINANITDLPGHAAGIGKEELDADDPGINASVVS